MDSTWDRNIFGMLFRKCQVKMRGFKKIWLWSLLTKVSIDSKDICFMQKLVWVAQTKYDRTI